MMQYCSNKKLKTHRAQSVFCLASKENLRSRICLTKFAKSKYATFRKSLVGLIFKVKLAFIPKLANTISVLANKFKSLCPNTVYKS